MLPSLEQNRINPLLSLKWNIHDCRSCSIGSKSFYPYSSYPTNILTYTPWTQTPPTQRHKLPWQTNTVKTLLQFINPYLSLWGAARTAEQSVVSPSSKPASPPSFTGGGKNFKGWQRKWKGTLFIRPRRETYRRSASALNQPRLLDMLNHRVAERQSRTDWREAGRVRDGDRNRRKILWNWRGTTQRDMADKSNQAMPHLSKSHIIFPLTYF